MSTRQRKILWVGVILFVLMGLFPPWFSPNHHIRYGSLLWPPMAQRDRDGYVVSYWQIDKDRLHVQWALVAAVTGALLATCRQTKEAKLPSQVAQ